MKNISNEVMEIITAMQHYIDKNRNTEVIDKILSNARYI